jgi:hypothetical protein
LDVNIIKRLKAAWLAGVLAVAIAPGAALADTGMSAEGGMGALSAISSLVYGPVKLVYALSGLIFGGIAWGLSGGDSEVMHAVVTPSVRGDYVVTPSHLRMERRLEFFGSDPAYRPQTAMVQDEVVIEEDF